MNNSEFSESDVKQIRSTLRDVEKAKSIELDQFTIKQSTGFEIWSDERRKAFESNSLTDLTTGLLNTYHYLITCNHWHESDINSWEYQESARYPKWTTPVNNLVACIQSQSSSYDKWRVKIPENGMDYITSTESFNIAVLNLLQYLKEYGAYNIEYSVRLQEIAKDKFEELPGIGSATARELVSCEVYTYSEFIDHNTYRLQTDCDEAKEVAKSRLENGSEITNHQDLSRIEQEVTIENI